MARRNLARELPAEWQLSPEVAAELRAELGEEVARRVGGAYLAYRAARARLDHWPTAAEYRGQRRRIVAAAQELLEALAECDAPAVRDYAAAMELPASLERLAGTFHAARARPGPPADWLRRDLAMRVATILSEAGHRPTSGEAGILAWVLAAILPEGAEAPDLGRLTRWVVQELRRGAPSRTG